ncbi:TolC family protein [Sulfurospirillum sp. 1307]
MNKLNVKIILIFLYLIITNSVLANGELSLLFSYDAAKNYKPDLKSYEFQTLAKKEDINQAKSRLFPKIDFSISGLQRNYKLNYNGNNREEKYYKGTISSKIPIYHPEYFNAIDQSELKYKYSSLYLSQKEQELAYNVIRAYISIIRAKNSLHVAKSYYEANKIRYEQIKKMYEKRLANKMDYFEAKLTLDQSKVKINEEKHNIDLAKLKFKDLVGLKDFKLADINFEKVNIDSLSFNFSYDYLYAHNLELKKAKLNIELSKKEIENSYNLYKPKVDLSASYSKYDNANVYSDYKDESTIMLNFSLPLYQGGYRRSKIVQSKYILSSANYSVEDIKNSIISDYEEVVVKLKNAKESVLLYKNSIKLAELYLHSVTKGYEKGLKSLIDVEDAKAKLYESKFKLIDATYQYLDSYAILLQYLGELNTQNISHLDDIFLNTM